MSTNVRVSNADLLKAMLAMQARIDSLEARLSAPVVAENIAPAPAPVKSSKSAKYEKSAAWNATLPAKYNKHKSTPAGESLVCAATYEGDWTWVTMSDAPTQEVVDIIKREGVNAKFSGGRIAWGVKRHVTMSEFFGTIAKYAK